MKKGKTGVEMRNIARALELKLRALEEAAEATTSRDCQAVAAAKIEYLSQILVCARGQTRCLDFQSFIEDELADAQAVQRLSRNPFMIAGIQVKIGLLESILRLMETRRPVTSAKRAVRTLLVPA